MSGYIRPALVANCCQWYDFLFCFLFSPTSVSFIVSSLFCLICRGFPCVGFSRGDRLTVGGGGICCWDFLRTVSSCGRHPVSVVGRCALPVRATVLWRLLLLWECSSLSLCSRSVFCLRRQRGCGHGPRAVVGGCWLHFWGRFFVGVVMTVGHAVVAVVLTVGRTVVCLSGDDSRFSWCGCDAHCDASAQSRACVVRQCSCGCRHWTRASLRVVLSESSGTFCLGAGLGCFQ